MNSLQAAWKTGKIRVIVIVALALTVAVLSLVDSHDGHHMHSRASEHHMSM